MSLSIIPNFTFNNGKNVPALGLGLWMEEPRRAVDLAESITLPALKHGYRHFDTATGYGNEQALGKAIRESNIPREEIFVTTKLFNFDHGRVREAFEESLKNFGLDYIDLWLLHWPVANKGSFEECYQPEESPTFVETWKEMEKIYAEGKVKAIGVSNFSIKNLEVLLKAATVVPVTNQVELHPAYPQHQLLDYCKSKGIILTAYSPLGQYNSPFYKDTEMQDIARKEDATVAQVLLSWGIQRGTIVIPKTGKEQRIIENAQIRRLSQESMAVLDNWHKKPGNHRPLGMVFSMFKPGTLWGWTYAQFGWDNLFWDEKANCVRASD